MTDKLLSSVLDLSRLMVEAGAEIYRVEDSVRRVCSAYGSRATAVYATTSNVIVSVEDADGVLKTHTCRIGSISTDIEKLDLLNSLTRRITAQTPAAEEVDAELRRISSQRGYPPVVRVLFYGIIAGAFCLFFGSRSIAQIGVATGIGLLVGLLSLFFERISANRLLARFACSFIASAAAYSFYRLGAVSSVDNIIIGNIMTLIPGIGLTTSLRDLFTGDSISGALRFIEAILLAAAIACGYVLTTFIFGGAL